GASCSYFIERALQPPRRPRLGGVGGACGERAGGGRVFTLKKEERAARRSVARCADRPRRYHGDAMLAGLVEMDAVGAVVFCAGRERIRPVDCVNDEMHNPLSYPSPSSSSIIPSIMRSPPCQNAGSQPSSPHGFTTS